MIQANIFNDFYLSVGVAAATKAKALCDHYGFSDESVDLVVPAADDLQICEWIWESCCDGTGHWKDCQAYPIKKSARAWVSARVLKDSLPATLTIITNLTNTSLASNCFAQVWKSAVAIRNLKSGDPDDPENTHLKSSYQ